LKHFLILQGINCIVQSVSQDCEHKNQTPNWAPKLMLFGKKKHSFSHEQQQRTGLQNEQNSTHPLRTGNWCLRTDNWLFATNCTWATHRFRVIARIECHWRCTFHQFKQSGDILKLWHRRSIVLFLVAKQTLLAQPQWAQSKMSGSPQMDDLDWPKFQLTSDEPAMLLTHTVVGVAEFEQLPNTQSCHRLC